MAKLDRDQVVREALALLDEVGLDKVSTRQLARRLDVEQPSLYWHFATKQALLAAMAAAAMDPLDHADLPTAGDDWAEWFTENTRTFRRTLLRHRDGARLHAGSRPVGSSLERVRVKLDFLVEAGLPRRPAEIATLAASRFTVGSVLEQQADEGERTEADAGSDDPTQPDHDEAFESGLALIVEGLARHRQPSPGAG